jgi:Spy/CpxP family protein refolding chaperone
MTLGPTGRTRLAGGAVLVLAFAAGGLGGAALERVRSAREPAADVVAERTRGNGEIDCDRYRQRRRGPYGSLGLSDDQAAQIDRIFDEQRTQMDAFWVDAGPRMNRILDETRAEVRAVLTDEQRAEYDENRERRRVREAERERQDSIRRAEIRERCGQVNGAPPSRRP